MGLLGFPLVHSFSLLSPPCKPFAVIQAEELGVILTSCFLLDPMSNPSMTPQCLPIANLSSLLLCQVLVQATRFCLWMPPAESQLLLPVPSQATVITLVHMAIVTGAEEGTELLCNAYRVSDLQDGKF
jgi:hypothetical protein